jgi:hypothetical protein
MNMNMNMTKIYLLILTCAFASPAFACKVNGTKFINMGVSTTEDRYFSYGLKYLDDIIPYSVVNNCGDTAAKRKYVMVAFGPEYVDLSDSIRGTNFNAQYEPAQCKIKNNPLKKITNDIENKKAFDKKWKYISECIEVQVTELGEKPLSYPQEQEGCKITPISSRSAIFKGGYCFFKPSFDSEYNVLIGVSRACQNIAGYKDLGVNLQDVNAGISYYTSSEAKGDVPDLMAIGSTSIRVSTNPVLPVVQPSEDFGIVRPTFPEIYPVNDLHLGKIEFFPLGDNDIGVKTPFVISNFCKEVESNGLKSSVCDYATPVVAEVTLKNSKGEVEATWFDGGVAPAQWQGILNGEGSKVAKHMLPTGKVYTLEMNFTDPYYDYGYFKKLVQNRIGAINIRMPILSNDGVIRDIPELKDIDFIDEMLEVSPIAGLNFKDKLQSLIASRKRLSGYFSTTMYPPIYTQACNMDSGECIKLGKSFVTFKATFLLNNDLSIGQLKVSRVSKLLGSYNKEINEQPEFNCDYTPPE